MDEPVAALNWRPVDVEADVDVVFDLISRCEREALGWTDATREDCVSMLGRPIAERTEHRIVMDGDEPVGLLLMEVDRPGREVYVDAYAVGLDHARVLGPLVAHGLGVARRVATDDPAPPASGVDPYVVSPDIWQAVAGSNAGDVAHAGVLEGAGFRAVRRFWRMELDLAGRSTAEPAPPTGVTLRVASGDDDRRIIHALEQDSFSEHFGVGHEVPYDTWLADIEARPGHDPARWWIASLDGEPVGLCILDWSRAEFGRDHVRLLGVIARARGRGIGRWLLELAAAQAAARGQAALALSVDGENTTGATVLYESVGFTTIHVVDAWCYPLPG